MLVGVGGVVGVVGVVRYAGCERDVGGSRLPCGSILMEYIGLREYQRVYLREYLREVPAPHTADACSPLMA